MTNVIEHRGPDGEGFYHGHQFAFGHRRLAIIDLDERSNQPMCGRDELVITYNGEVYNYIELRDELVKHGYNFKTESDTEVILAAYHFWGKACLDKFNGMWSFAIFDPRKNEVFVARDRFGIKPLYYTRVGENMGFASEIKQFTTLPNWQAKANQEQLFRFIVGGELDTTNKTMFEGVFQVLGGHCGIYNLDDHSFQIDQWYSLEESIKKLEQNAESASNIFKSIFEDSVRLRLRSDVNVGSCLSGGMDSSAIVTMMDDLLKHNNGKTVQHTISSCFEDKAYDEQEYIDEVLKYTNTKGHKVFPNEDDLFKNIDKMIWHQDEPFGSTSIFAQWTVFDKAKKENLKVMLDGQGADEQLAGYSSFSVHYVAKVYDHFGGLG